MKLEVNSGAVQSGGIYKRKKFETVKNSKLAAMLSSDIYKDGVEATVREIGTNAIDAHIMSNNNNPFYIHIPTIQEPYFIVRDYGPGMDEAELDTLYSVYGASSKDDNNDAIGAFGLGSKSPLAYVQDSFSVISRKNGYQYSCVVSLDEAAEPELTYFPIVHTTEPNGLEVRVDVKREDITDFQNKIQKVYSLFGKWIPKTNGIPIKPVEYDFKNDDYGIRKDTNYNRFSYNYTKESRAIMGHVAYPIDPQYFSKYKPILELGLDLFFPIGAFNIGIGREAPKYTKFTISTLTDKLEKISQQMRKKYLDIFANEKTSWECSLTVFKNGGLRKEFEVLNKVERFKYKNSDISESFTIDSECYYYHYYNKTKKSNSTSSWINPQNSIIVVNDGLGAENVCRYLAEQNKNFKVYQITTEKYDEYKKSNFLRDEVVKFVSKVYPTIKNTITRKKYGVYSTCKIFKFVKGTSTNTYWKEEDINFDDGGVYVHINRYNPVITGMNITTENLYSFYSDIQKVIGNFELIGVKSADVERFQKSKLWVSFDEYILSKLKTVLTNGLEDEYSIFKGYSTTREYYDSLEAVNKLIKRCNLTNGPLVDYSDRVSKVFKKYNIPSNKGFYSITSKIPTVYSLIEVYFKDKISVDGVSTKSILDKYPMLVLLPEFAALSTAEEEKVVSNYIKEREKK